MSMEHVCNDTDKESRSNRTATASTPIFLPFHMDWSGIGPGSSRLGYGNSPSEQVWKLVSRWTQ